MKTLLLVSIIAIVATAVISISLLYNQEIKLLTGMMTSEKNPRTTPVISLHDIAEITSYKGKDCNQFGFSDVNCFIDSFSSCINAKIEDTHYTVEGDPITMIAMIKNKDGACTIDVFEDTTKDRFGEQKITEYSCSGIKLDEMYLNIYPCTKDSDEDVYGFLIQKPV